MTTVQIRPEVIWCSNLCLQFEFYHTHVNFSLSSIPSKSQQVLLDYFYPNVLLPDTAGIRTACRPDMGTEKKIRL